MSMDRNLRTALRSIGALEGVSLLSALLLGLAFVRSDLAWVGFVAFVSFFQHAVATPNKKQAWWGGFVFGFVYLLVVFSWLLSAFPLDWLFPNPLIAGSVIGVIWVSVAVLGGCIYGCISLLVRATFTLGRGKALAERGVLFTVVGGLSLVLFSYLHMFVLAVVFAGQWGIQPFISYGAPGYLLADYGGLRLLATHGDIYMLGMLIGCVGAFGAFVWEVIPRHRYSAVALAVIALVVSNSPVSYTHLTLPTKRIV